MTEIWSALQASDLAVWINYSRWAYAAVATVHVLAIGALIGSILTLDLRLMGVGRWLDPHQLARFVVPVAGTAFCFAIVSGVVLFIGRAGEYAAFGTFRIKIALIVVAVAMIAASHVRYGMRLERASDRQRFHLGLASILLWLGVAVSGRMIAFVHG
tara:strand:- start:12156 stop:12626 length:471 start_codon:yes stop_codon:yes gene_type:complete